MSRRQRLLLAGLVALSATISCTLLIVDTAAAHAVTPTLLRLENTEEDRWWITWKRIERRVDEAGSDPELGIYGCEADTTPERWRDGVATVDRWSVSCSGLVAETSMVTGFANTAGEIMLEILPEPGVVRRELRALAGSRLVVHLRGASRDSLMRAMWLGATHVAGGLDHILFLLAMLIMVGRRPAAILLAVTGFTVGHSASLLVVAKTGVTVAPAPTEALIAASIVLVASELTAPPGARASLIQRRPGMVTVVFGLVHGLGFAGALTDLGLAQAGGWSRLLGFNLGVELGQLVIIGAVSAALLLTGDSRAGRIVSSVLASAIGACGGFLFFQRVAVMVAT